MRDQLYKAAIWMIAINGILWGIRPLLGQVLTWDALPGLGILGVFTIFIFSSVGTVAAFASLYILIALYLKKTRSAENNEPEEKYSSYLLHSGSLFVLIFIALLGSRFDMSLVYLFPNKVFAVEFVIGIVAAAAGIYTIVRNKTVTKQAAQIQANQSDASADNQNVPVKTKEDRNLLYLLIVNIGTVAPGILLIIDSFLNPTSIAALGLFPFLFVTPIVLMVDIALLYVFIKRHKTTDRRRQLLIGSFIASMLLFAVFVLHWSKLFNNY